MYSSLSFQRLLAATIVLVLVGCSSQPAKEEIKPSAPRKPAAKSAPIAPKPKPLTGLPLINSLLPQKLTDRGGWAADMLSAFDALKIVPTKENVCAVIAEIEQESSFQAEPMVPGLSKIVRRELDARREKYSIPQWLMDSSLDRQSPDGRTYNQRIDTLKTENEVNTLYQDMTSEIPFGKDLLADYNPVHTGGPMQVGVTFANTYTAAKPYPYGVKTSLRNELFTRKGGLYFGMAYLLDYPAKYESLTYRFADFNAGIYSSRNAAFQKAVSSLSGITLDPDGDLLRYKDGVALEEPASQTMKALLAIAPRLNMDKTQIYRDLLQEKSPGFEQTSLYQKIFALAPAMPRACVPEIVLTSPKFTRKLTTVNYAKQVDGRYQRCMKK
jgi:hypothetical protein